MGYLGFFYMRIFRLDACSYLRQTPAKSLATAKKENKYKCLQPCLERISTFTPMVYSAGGITGTEAISVQRHLASLLSNNLKRGYLEMCGFIRSRMPLAVVRSNTLLLRGIRYKEAYILQRHYLADGLVISQFALCRG